MPGGLFNYNIFKKELRGGYTWQEKCAEIIREMGHLVISSPYEIVEDKSPELKRFANSVDLLVDGYVVEVKSTHYAFTEPTNWPYYKVYVDTVQGWNKKNPEPIGVIRVSQKTGAILYISRMKTRHIWKIDENILDKIRNIRDDFYWCPRNNAESLEALNMDIKELGSIA